ncbi:DUF559 domain-containing protein [Nocardioides sp. NPDC006273]|uniref:DUF559 domain-containing protein n=1 Tax=Nocardioides sp. NPDC006273 TaxID=3155598 RepID=UPI0033A020C1
MDAEAVLRELGGAAPYRALLASSTRSSIRKAVTDGRIVRVEHGRYALPATADGLDLATRIGGALALRSAAAAHGWALKTEPTLPEIAVPRGTRRGRGRSDARVLWLRLELRDVRNRVTTPLRTVIDCARQLPFDEALAVADSALRSGQVTDLGSVRVSGAGAARVHKVLDAAHERAANPFESVLRALCLDSGLDVVPQRAVLAGGIVFHPDLTCLSKGVLIEADSFTFHSGRDAFSRDCERYNCYTLAGWRLIRFTYEQVMSGQNEVLRILSRVAALPDADGELLARSLVNLRGDADRTATNDERAASQMGDGPSRTR